MKSKPKFPKEYYEIEKVEGITEEAVKAYRSLIRHEMYEEKKRKQNARENGSVQICLRNALRRL